jgi:hypothetical protein
MTVHALHVDIEEEAEIMTLGNVWWGDSKTLEIVNEFSVAPGTSIRSMLLWNGNAILKAKLKLKADADEQYENVVDRQQVQQAPRDPALIEYIGKDSYRCRIYPVASGNSRKIRILYTVPLRIVDNVPCFEIGTIFTTGASENPGQIPVYIVKAPDAFEKYIMKSNASQKTITFGSVYMINYADLVNYDQYSWSNPTSSKLIIIPDKTHWNSAWSSHVPTGAAKGYFTAIVTSVPEAVTELMAEQVNESLISLQAGITIGKKNYLADISTGSYWSVFCKSDTIWDGVVNWTAYGDTGSEVFTYKQSIPAKSTSLMDSSLPLIWGAKYTLDEGNGNTGALFGFIDPSMSLLALENDTLSKDAAGMVSEDGVPVLFPEEIIINSAKLPATPKESVIFDFNTSVIETLLAHTNFEAVLTKEGVLQLSLPEGLERSIAVRLLDLNGRVTHNWKNIECSGAHSTTRLPGTLHGAYVIQIRIGSHTLQKKIVVR